MDGRDARASLFLEFGGGGRKVRVSPRTRVGSSRYQKTDTKTPPDWKRPNPCYTTTRKGRRTSELLRGRTRTESNRGPIPPSAAPSLASRSRNERSRDAPKLIERHRGDIRGDLRR